jgi:hypothetical protein
VLIAVGVLLALSMPVLNVFGSALALVVAAVLAGRGDRRAGLIVAGTTVLVLLLFFLLLTPVHSGGVQIRRDS